MKPFRIFGTLTLLAAVIIAAFFYMRAHRTDAVPVTVTYTPLADDLVVLFEPAPGARGVTSPLIVRGKARGSWYSEAVFPVVLTDSEGRILAQTQAHAITDWMTTDFVEFEATLVFGSDTGSTGRGVLTLKKDNPSGLPERDDQRAIAVFFR